VGGADRISAERAPRGARPRAAGGGGGRPRGRGALLPFPPPPAYPRWPALPLWGAFVEMPKRIVSLPGPIATADPNAAGSGRGSPREVVPPTRILDGFGVFGPPPPYARPVAAGFSGRGSADHPPGFYWPPEGLLP